MAMLCGQRKEEAAATTGTTEAGSSSGLSKSPTFLLPVAPACSESEQAHGPAVSEVRQDDQGRGGLFRVRLRNPHNLRYANAGILAMLHALQEGELPRGLKPLRDALANYSGAEVNLTVHFGLRPLFRGWSLDPRQKDAAEFIDFLLGKAGFVHPVWEARALGGGVHSVVDAGSGMLYLALPARIATCRSLLVLGTTRRRPMLSLLRRGALSYSWAGFPIGANPRRKCASSSRLMCRSSRLVFNVLGCPFTLWQVQFTMATHPTADTIARCSDYRMLGG